MDKVRLLKALADGTRMKIVEHLADGERCACTIPPVIGRAQSTVSGHLRILEEAGVLSSRKLGKNIWYKVESKEARKILDLLKVKR